MPPKGRIGGVFIEILGGVSSGISARYTFLSLIEIGRYTIRFLPTYPHFTSAQIVDGGLIVQPENIALVTVQGGHFPEGVYHAFDYSLLFENLKANIAERIDAFTHK
ncbi:hypothetical protein [Desulfobacter postgatei]|jgi:hypothetical protein|uniref:hypothetical protein n=1 Tax=Desulfobacter postgatei TaxID=2293 RepID=UPI002A35BAFA|nr:hypothetical protein [Desulfobacter postgatei]MDX9964100.1 hypothetical protein [Desulfobacter postgatei]